jgi:hypothetical protein
MLRIMPEVRKTLRLPVEAAESVFGSDPERANPVFVDHTYEIIAEAVRIVRIMPVTAKLIAIVFVQAAMRPDPQKSLVILYDGGHPEIGQIDLKVLKPEHSSSSGNLGRCHASGQAERFVRIVRIVGKGIRHEDDEQTGRLQDCSNPHGHFTASGTAGRDVRLDSA